MSRCQVQIPIEPQPEVVPTQVAADDIEVDLGEVLCKYAPRVFLAIALIGATVMATFALKA